MRSATADHRSDAMLPSGQTIAMAPDLATIST